MAETPYPAIDYTSRDYASLRQTMIDGIPSRIPEWTSRSPNDFGVVLIELFATMGDILSYYIDRVANESFLPTATQRESVLSLASLLNYRPRGLTAAVTELQFTVTGAGVTIPAGTEVRSSTMGGGSPVIFTTDVAVTSEEATTVSVAATQGVMVRQERIGTATGVVGETYRLLQTPVVDDSLTIQIRDSDTSPVYTWYSVDSLLDARPTDSVYVTQTDANGLVSVTFGDGVNGRLLPRASQVLATYRVGGGATGNVTAGALTELADPVSGVLSVTNPAAANGGADVESIESIRINAPRSLQALNRAVTLDDYAALALQIPRVAKAKADAAVYSNVSLYIAPAGGGPPDQFLLNTVVMRLASRKMIGVDVVAASPTYVPIDINVTVTVNSAYSTADITAAVGSLLRNRFTFDLVDFAERVTVGDIYARIATIPGVSHASLTQLARRGEFGVTDVILAANEIPVAGTINVSGLGGISAADPTQLGTTGNLPVASSAPEIYIARCDPTTTHLGLRWSPGIRTTHWYVELLYMNSLGETLSSTTVGPAYNGSSFEIDVAKNTTAVAIGVRTQAYNGSTGPVYSPITTITNPCA